MINPLTKTEKYIGRCVLFAVTWIGITLALFNRNFWFLGGSLFWFFVSVCNRVLTTNEIKL